MPLLAFHDLGLIRQDRWLFRHLHGVIEAGQRIALVAPNGTGKTSLLRLLAGAEEPDEGSVRKPANLRLAAMWQEDAPPTDMAVAPYAQSLLGGWAIAHRQLEAAQQSLGPNPSATELRKLSRLEDRFAAVGGWSVRTELDKQLSLLQLERTDWSRPVAELSGGQRMRIRIAALAAQDASLWILDEPTNHLDRDGRSWLKKRLQQTPSFLLVAHDPDFLEGLTDQVWHLDANGIAVYHLGFAAYLAARTAGESQLSAQRERLGEEREKLQAFIRKFGSGTRATQAKDREKKLARLKEPPPTLRPPVARPRFSTDGKDGVLLLAEHLAAGVGGKVLVEDLTINLERGSRLVVSGPNGAGKTTLLRTLAGELAPLAGRIRLGTGVRRAWVSQSPTWPNPAADLVTHLTREVGVTTIHQAISLLARYGLSAHRETAVGQLSGGERTRLAIAGLEISGASVLLLDEPTNNLDQTAQEGLAQALADYPGAVVVATHDQRFSELMKADVLQIGTYRSDRPGTAHPHSHKPGPAKTPPVPVAPDWSQEIARLEAKLAQLATDMAGPALEVDARRRLALEAEALARDLDSAWAAFAQDTDREGTPRP
ncbi:MAG: ABC-F family ATP-binding cassette domain-containing protein [Sulfobacillus sp.]